MKAKNLLKVKNERYYLMDRESDRYRVCPNDGVEFMANDRTEKYCCVPVPSVRSRRRAPELECC